MPSPLALESLKILAGSPGFSNYGARPQLPINIGRNQAKVAAEAAALGVPELASGEYSQQDVDETFNQAQNEALKRLIMPIQAKGQYELAAGQQAAQAGMQRENLRGQYGVEAAKQHAVTQAERDQQLFGNRMESQASQNAAVDERVAAQQRALDARAAAAQKAIGIRQQIASKTKDLSKASGSGLGNLFGFLGPSQKDKLQAEIAALQAQEGAAPEAAAAPATGARMTRRLKNGGIAYSDDGGATWYQD
jgi:hypothetical protein